MEDVEHQHRTEHRDAVEDNCEKGAGHALARFQRGNRLSLTEQPLGLDDLPVPTVRQLYRPVDSPCNKSAVGALGDVGNGGRTGCPKVWSKRIA